jgi:large subunit ribosomal protein L21
VLREDRFDKILVFKLKRKKQYKKMQGHRQSFVEVRIGEISVNGKSFKAEEAGKKAAKGEGAKAKKAAASE